MSDSTAYLLESTRISLKFINKDIIYIIDLSSDKFIFVDT